MFTSQLYRRAIRRLAISVMLTVIEVFLYPLILYFSLGDLTFLFIALAMLFPVLYTLGEMWRHTVDDLATVVKKTITFEVEHALYEFGRDAVLSRRSA